ncbi:PREDICTED: transcription factor bHLH117-like [Brassica oleracea var. oleracea]|uniref:transcription factor bHLH117-like n=1 Tax=Brassica oleracea var. oleracea TaxID=109376 RepID=UPI0006A756BC|nr:PREDICTED: transcription factor bHLH117-like [Brassica oleracea var. oleracea]
MESCYEFASLSELPPLPQAYAPMEEYYPYDIAPLESLPPFPHSDFAPHGGLIPFSDTHQDYLQLQKQQHCAESMFTDSSLPLVTRDYLTESTRFENLFSHDVPFLHLPDLKFVEGARSPPPCLSLAPPPPLPVARHNVNLRQRHVGSRVNNTFSISPSSSSKSKPPASQYVHGTRKVSDRIRSLEKIMPWEKKMSLATTLEETNKYITFLQSQIASLRWMPLDSVYPKKKKKKFYRRQPQNAAFGRGVRRSFLRQRNEQELTQNVDVAAAAGTCGNQTNSPLKKFPRDDLAVLDVDHCSVDRDIHHNSG